MFFNFHSVLVAVPFLITMQWWQELCASMHLCFLIFTWLTTRLISYTCREHHENFCDLVDVNGQRDDAKDIISTNWISIQGYYVWYHFTAIMGNRGKHFCHRRFCFSDRVSFRVHPVIVCRNDAGKRGNNNLRAWTRCVCIRGRISCDSTVGGFQSLRDAIPDQKRILPDLFSDIEKIAIETGRVAMSWLALKKHELLREPLLPEQMQKSHVLKRSSKWWPGRWRENGSFYFQCHVTSCRSNQYSGDIL